VRLYREAAEAGHSGAQYRLGQALLEGQGLRRDPIEASRWFRKAAEQGYARAQYQFGLMLIQGDGMPRDILEAARWLGMAAETGDVQASIRLGLLFEEGPEEIRNPRLAEKWLRLAAESGYADSQYRLARLYAEGRGVPRNLEEAIVWLRRSAEQGHLDSLYQLARLYDEGLGVALDSHEAIALYRRAAKQGHARAQTGLDELHDVRAPDAPRSVSGIEIETSPVFLDSERPGLRRVGEIEFLAGLSLRADHPEFTGLSGLAFTDDDRQIVSTTDNGYLLTARLRLDSDGRLIGLDGANISSLLRPDGRVIRADERWRDAEAVERLADGRFVVGFEGWHRLWRYRMSPGQLSGAAEPLPLPWRFQDMPTNGGVEALAPLPDGRLLLFSEEFLDSSGDLIGWLWDESGSEEVRYVVDENYRPTDLAALPNGDFLVLERSAGLLGVRGSRLMRLRADTIISQERLYGEEIARLAPPLTVENFEGLAVAPAKNGDIVIYLLSDDNSNFFQRTLLMQFRLGESSVKN
jgi:TPR repeat protein